jgi:2-keto-4-pentenoate hydratase/2-oxohepta-3-ene-1,7-dioic acid hydratase in catechol pathway
MGLALVRYKTNSGLITWGYVDGERVFAFDSSADTLAEFLKNDPFTLSHATKESESLAEVELLAPLTAPCQIICQGKNYLDHLLETGVKPKNKEFNLLFTKAPSTLAPARGKLVKPARVKLLDYELELGLVMRKKISGPITITKENIFEYVAGLVMANDISARDIQVPERQWFKGKSLRGFCPVGPWIWLWTREEATLLHDLELELKVNGEKRQKSNTKLLLHSPEDTLTQISELFDLYPGDILLTGTPGGVSMRVKAKSRWEEILDALSGKSDKQKFAEFIAEQAASGRYLKAGDKIESTIRSIDGRIDLGKQKLEVV